jgi:acyl-CoA synthetase (AMP-forming)/AMP-acid ligase II
VAIVSATRLEWILADLAVACAGGVTATVYPVSTEEDTSFILTDSRAAIVFAEDAAQARRIVSRRDALPCLDHLVLFDASAGLPGDALSLLDLAALGRAWDAAHPGGFDAAAGAAGPSDLATLIYTSGTTGRPKGVELPHDAHIERFVPHGPILRRAAAVVCHGGMGVTQKALAAGVPVCVVPFGRDQLEVARHVEVAGAGTRSNRCCRAAPVPPTRQDEHSTALAGSGRRGLRRARRRCRSYGMMLILRPDCLPRMGLIKWSSV